MLRHLSLAAFLLIIALPMVPPSSAEELPLGSPLPLPCGDWVVRTPLVLSDVTITLRGDLIVEQGGSLDLEGVRIQLDGSTDGERKVEVRDGGSLLARRSRLTGHATTFARGERAGRYLFTVSAGASFLLDGAEIRDAGWNAAHPGLVVERDSSAAPGEVLVFDTDFHDDFVGLTLRGSSDVVMVSRFFQNQYAGLVLHRSPATLVLLEIRAHPIGILLDAESDALLRGVQIQSNDVGLLGYDSVVELDHSLFAANGEHVRFEGPRAARIHDNLFLFASGTAVTTAAGAMPILDHNDFARNSFGLRNQDPVPHQPLLATDNYWGAANGPGGAGPGQGDPVSEGVAFSPWCPETCTRTQDQ